MLPPRGLESPFNFLTLGLAAFAIAFGCRAGDLLTSIRDSRAAGAATARTATTTQVALAGSPTETATETPAEVAIETPTETSTETPEPSATPAPTDTPEPSETSAPLPTRTRAPPTRIPPPTQTFTPAPPPSPTRCPNQFCVIKSDCIPGQDTRAIGHIYSNGVPVNGIRVRVSYDYGGAPVTGDFISGHEQGNQQKLWVDHEGYYQVGIVEGSAQDANWWVFLLDQGGNVISEGRWFKTADVTTDTSCNIGVTDFAS